jgi:hypothetical protein
MRQRNESFPRTLDRPADEIRILYVSNSCHFDNSFCSCWTLQILTDSGRKDVGILEQKVVSRFESRDWEADLWLLVTPTMRAQIVFNFTPARRRLKLF